MGGTASGPNVKPDQYPGATNFGGGYSGGKTPPQQPDFYGAAGATSQGSQQAVGQQTEQNRPFQYTPFASSGWYTDDKGRPIQNTQLAGGLGGAATGLEGQIGGQAGTPLPTGEEGRQAAMQGVRGYASSYLDPIFSRRQAEQQASQAAQGIQGTPQASFETQQLGQQENQARLGVEDLAQRTGREAQAQTFQQDVAGRMLPYQQLGGLQGLTQMPGFNPAGQYKPTDYLSAAALTSGAAGQNYGSQMQKKGSTGAGVGGALGGLGTLGALRGLGGGAAAAPITASTGGGMFA